MRPSRGRESPLPARYARAFAARDAAGRSNKHLQPLPTSGERDCILYNNPGEKHPMIIQFGASDLSLAKTQRGEVCWPIMQVWRGWEMKSLWRCQEFSLRLCVFA